MSLTTTRRTGRAGALRRTALAAAGALALGGLQAGAATAEGSRTWVVQPGGSIQAAVDQARSGDTIRIAAGTYHESVCIEGKGLKVLGAGHTRTKIVWPAWDSVEDLPAVEANACLTAHEGADAEGDPSDLADDVSGLFFLDPDSPVVVHGLSTRNHPADGIAAWGADGFSVSGTSGEGHERYGVIAADSTRVSIINTVHKGVVRSAPVYSGTAGISVGDSERAKARISGNVVQGYNLGIFLRESRSGGVSGNYLTRNCIGVLVFDDSATEVPDRTRGVVGGDWRITGNTLVANNRYCLAGRDGSQRTSGVGVAVTNADRVLIKDNVVRGHRPVVPAGEVPINFPAAGVVLQGFAPPPGTNPPGAADPGTVEHVRVIGNTFSQNSPLDISVSRKIPQNPLILDPGPGIVFAGNLCRASDPAAACGG